MTDGLSTAARFPATSASAVALVGSDDPAARARAFERLVRAYWRPAYAHVRLKWRRAPEDARDLVQGFFTRALEMRKLAGYDPAKARFRTYLRGALDHFVADEARAAQRGKRGGGLARLSLDFEGAEAELARSGPRNPAEIEACFDAEWTRTLFEGAVAALERTCEEQGKSVHFALFRRAVLEPELGEVEARPSYAELARDLGISVTDVTNHLAWVRRTFRAHVVEELRTITSSEEELREEARAVLGIDP